MYDRAVGEALSRGQNFRQFSRIWVVPGEAEKKSTPRKGSLFKGKELSRSSEMGKLEARHTDSSHSDLKHSHELRMPSGLMPKYLTLFS